MGKSDRVRTRPTELRAYTKPEYEAKVAVEGFLDARETILQSRMGKREPVARQIAKSLDHVLAALDKKGVECICEPPEGAAGFDPRATTRAAKWACICKTTRKRRS